MDTETYKRLHFDIEHESFIRKQIKYDSVEDFEIRFPGVTMDFSTALSNAWLESVTGLLQKMFGPTATLSQKGHEALKKFCSVHYKGNVVKVSNVSVNIPMDKKHQFKELCWKLLDDISFGTFEKTVRSMIVKFPKVAGWVKWYLNERVAPYIFPACNSVKDDDMLMKRLKSLSLDTNPQEGLGSSLKAFLGKSKLHPNELVQGILRWVVALSEQRVAAKQG
jgi:hypothetical protein